MKNISFDEFIRYVAAVENRAVQNRDEIAIKLEDGARALLKAPIASSQATAAFEQRRIRHNAAFLPGG